MTVDFKAEVKKRKDAMMEDLFALLRINSERDDSKADKEHPFDLVQQKHWNTSLQWLNAMVTKLVISTTTLVTLNLVKVTKYLVSLLT